MIGKIESSKRVVCYFEGLFCLGSEDLEKLMVLLEEELASQYRNVKFNFVINIVDKYQLIFRQKNLCVERINFLGGSELFYKVLLKHIRHSLLPGPVFGSSFLLKLEQNFKDHCVSIMREASQWRRYREIYYLLNRSALQSAEQATTLNSKVKRLNILLQIGYKLCKIITLHYFRVSRAKLAQVVFEILVNSHEVCLSKYVSDAESLKISFAEKLENFLNETKLKIDQVPQIVDKIKSLIVLLKKPREKSAMLTRQSSKSRLSKADKMAAFCGGISRPKDQTSELITSIRSCFISTFGEFFRSLDIELPYFVIKDYYQLNSKINPDPKGALYKQLMYIPSDLGSLQSNKRLFEILAGCSVKTSAVDVFKSYYKRNNSRKSDVDQKLTKPQEMDWYLYSLRVFEHLRLIKLTYQNTYKIEKKFFSKRHLEIIP